jgi:hypothetical protein
VGRLRSVRVAGAIAPVARQFVYTACTANDATITLPDVVKNDLLQIGLAHQAIALTRVGFTGEVSTSFIDMTPRTGNSSKDPVLVVTGRAVPAIYAKISAIEKTINSPGTTTCGGRALYAGLTKTDFTGAPVTLISSGIDLASPDDFRALKWSVPPEEVVARVKKSGALPTLHSPVTFVVVPTAGLQTQLGQAQRAGSLAPWLEAAGFFTFLTYYLNVVLLQPWVDWLGWSFAVTVVVVIILGQTWLVRHAARSHNHAREARADGNRHEAERALTRRNWYIGLTGVTAAAITSGMIWRGIAALGDASVGTTAVMVFVAAVTGLLLPTLAYLGIALDGSKVSRERDSLTADLDDDLDAYLENISNSRRDLASVAEIGDTLKNKTFPDICNTTKEAVDAVYGFYGTVRLLIGGLSADPPPKKTKTISQDANGTIHGHIGTSIPGTRRVNLDQLFDRWRRLAKIESQRTDLLDRMDALPPHPWGKSRTV